MWQSGVPYARWVNSGVHTVPNSGTYARWVNSGGQTVPNSGTYARWVNSGGQTVPIGGNRAHPDVSKDGLTKATQINE